MNKRIIVASHDKEYLNRVEMEVALALRHDVTLIFSTSSESLHEIEREGYPADILFIDEKMMCEFHRGIPVRKVIRIADDSADSAESIRKIDGAHALLKHVDSAMLQGAAELEKRPTKIVHVFSLAGGSGKTLTSIGIAHSLSKRGWKVLYMNMDALQDFQRYLKQDEQSYATETLAITLAVENASQVKNLLSEIANDGFDYIPPFRQFLDAYALSAQNIERAADRVADAAIYDIIILEHPAGLQESMISPKRQGDRLVYVGMQSPLCADRLHRISGMNARAVKEAVLVNGCSRERDKNHLGIVADECGTSICEKIRYTENPDPLHMLEEGVFSNIVEAVLLQ